MTAGEHCSGEVVTTEKEMTVNDYVVLMRLHVLYLCQQFTVIYNR
jgi:hypothetical protein